ncbi:MAG: hypothetical protein IJ471_01235, partial [Eubacterium sp.]|nr:hypothetical protein [Eubacterium sp.]
MKKRQLILIGLLENLKDRLKVLCLKDYYFLGGLSNNIFESRYVLYMPDKEQLIAQIEAVLERW